MITALASSDPTPSGFTNQYVDAKQKGELQEEENPFIGQAEEQALNQSVRDALGQNEAKEEYISRDKEHSSITQRNTAQMTRETYIQPREDENPDQMQSSD